MSEYETVVLRTYWYEYEALLAQDLLGSYDLPSHVTGESWSHFTPAFRLVVLREDALRAKAILDGESDE